MRVLPVLLALVGIAACDGAEREAERDSIAAHDRWIDSVAKLGMPPDVYDRMNAARSAPAPAAKASHAGEDADTTATMFVCVERRDSLMVYHYTVRNGPRALLRVIYLGFGAGREADSTDNPDGGGELSHVPFGSRLDWTDDGRFEPPGVTSPPHWYAEPERVEETSGGMIIWHAERNEFGIRPGETRGGFSVAVVRGDSGYATGHWSMHVDAPTNYVGRLRRVPGDSGCAPARSP